MKKLTIAIVLLVAALATAGQMRHPSNPLTVGGSKLETAAQEWPEPPCIPTCGRE